MTDLPTRWRADAATMRRYGIPGYPDVIEALAAELEAEGVGETGNGETLPRVLDADAIAAALDVNRQRAYELIRTGKLPGIRLGRQVRVTREALERFIAEGGAA